MPESDPAQPLRDLKPEKEFFVGIDSDGCAFDTMEIKHKECFIPNIVKHWSLQPVSKYARQAAEFWTDRVLQRPPSDGFMNELIDFIADGRGYDQTLPAEQLQTKSHYAAALCCMSREFMRR